MWATEELDKVEKIINNRISRLKELNTAIKMNIRNAKTNRFLKYLDTQYMICDKLITKMKKTWYLMTNYPKSINCNINIPALSYKELNKWLKENFNFDIDFDHESDYWEQIFYNADLRSFMGCLTDEIYYEGDTTLTVHLLLQHYVKGFENYWFNIIENSDILANL